MLYKKIHFVGLAIYATLSRTTSGGEYIAYADKTPNGCSGAGASDSCTFYCDKKQWGQDFDCGDAGICNISCDQKKCFELSTITATNSNLLNVEAGGQQLCFSGTTFHLPASGSANFNDDNNADDPYQSITINAGTNTEDIYINCAGDDGKDQCTSMTINATTAQSLHININGNGEMEGLDTNNMINIYCPQNVLDGGINGAPCYINALSKSKLINVNIHTLLGIPYDLWIDVDDAKNFNNVILTCTDYDSAAAVAGKNIVKLTTKDNDCWNTRSPTTAVPTQSPVPTPEPTKFPTTPPTKKPTINPTTSPTKTPTIPPTQPTQTPTSYPTRKPTNNPTLTPTLAPVTRAPSKNPTKYPTLSPTKYPTLPPTLAPITRAPSKNPTKYPTLSPTKYPTKYPTVSPTKNPSKQPTFLPSKPPTKYPTEFPSKPPTKNPSTSPTIATNEPSDAPTPKMSTTVADDNLMGAAQNLTLFLVLALGGMVLLIVSLIALILFVLWFKKQKQDLMAAKRMKYAVNQSQQSQVSAAKTSLPQTVEALEGSPAAPAPANIYGSAYVPQPVAQNDAIAYAQNDVVALQHERNHVAVTALDEGDGDSHDSDDDIMDQVNMTAGGPVGMIADNSNDDSDDMDILDEINQTQGGPVGILADNGNDDSDDDILQEVNATAGGLNVDHIDVQKQRNHGGVTVGGHAGNWNLM